MRARAEAAEATERRILEAARALFATRWYDDVTLADVAAEAGVSSQTVIRRFGSKDGLIDAVTERVRGEVVEQRGEAPAGDVRGAIATLVEHYEREGDAVLRLLAQEDRVPAFRRVTDGGRALHYAWVDRVFGPALARLAPAERARRRAGLIAACDVSVWKVLRRDLALPREDVERTLADLVAAQLKGA
jgi:AcrR family transcriptional regulator